MEGARFWSYFWGKNMPIYMAKCSLLVLVGPLDTGSCPSVVIFKFCDFNETYCTKPCDVISSQYYTGGETVIDLI